MRMQFIPGPSVFFPRPAKKAWPRSQPHSLSLHRAVVLRVRLEARDGGDLLDGGDVACQSNATQGRRLFIIKTISLKNYD